MPSNVDILNAIWLSLLFERIMLRYIPTRTFSLYPSPSFRPLCFPLWLPWSCIPQSMQGWVVIPKHYCCNTTKKVQLFCHVCRTFCVFKYLRKPRPLLAKRTLPGGPRAAPSYRAQGKKFLWESLIAKNLWHFCHQTSNLVCGMWDEWSKKGQDPYLEELCTSSPPSVSL